MAEKLEDLNLPAAVVTRIIKEALPEGCNVAKEAKLALSKAASVFVLYLTSHANKISIENGKKMITNEDVMNAIRDTEFGRFEKQLIEAAEHFRKVQNSKREASSNKKRTKDSNQHEDGQENIDMSV